MTILYIERGKKYYSFKCPFCKAPMRRQYIGATFVCGSYKNSNFKVRPKKGKKKKWN